MVIINTLHSYKLKKTFRKKEIYSVLDSKSVSAQ